MVSVGHYKLANKPLCPYLCLSIKGVLLCVHNTGTHLNYLSMLPY